MERASWVHNPKAALLFEAMLDTITAQHKMNPKAFCKDTWRYKEEEAVATAQNYLDILESRRQKGQGLFGNPATSLSSSSSMLHVPVLPFIQGTGENAAHRIAKNGFGTTATTDPGWYGQGMYFTTRVSYAHLYSSGVYVILSHHPR